MQKLPVLVPFIHVSKTELASFQTVFLHCQSPPSIKYKQIFWFLSYVHFKYSSSSCNVDDTVHFGVSFSCKILFLRPQWSPIYQKFLLIAALFSLEAIYSTPSIYLDSFSFLYNSVCLLYTLLKEVLCELCTYVNVYRCMCVYVLGGSQADTGCLYQSLPISYFERVYHCLRAYWLTNEPLAFCPDLGFQM